MITRFFTFGQQHKHVVNNNILDRDCVVRITDESPRKIMHEVFGSKWSMEYDSLASLHLELYPRGIYNLNIREWVEPGGKGWDYSEADEEEDYLDYDSRFGL